MDVKNAAKSVAWLAAVGLIVLTATKLANRAASKV